MGIYPEVIKARNSVAAVSGLGVFPRPDFDGHAVDFDELMRHLGRFRAEERDALERWTQRAGCKLEGAARGAG